VTGNELDEQETPGHDERDSHRGERAPADPGDPEATRLESLEETWILCC
jgi:hypothetical protein